MGIQTYHIDTCMGKCHGPMGFLTPGQKEEFNIIGYTGKNSQGMRTAYVDYLNSQGIGVFKINQTQFDHGDWWESFIIIHVTEGK